MRLIIADKLWMQIDFRENLIKPHLSYNFMHVILNSTIISTRQLVLFQFNSISTFSAGRKLRPIDCVDLVFKSKIYCPIANANGAAGRPDPSKIPYYTAGNGCYMNRADIPEHKNNPHRDLQLGREIW